MSLSFNLPLLNDLKPETITLGVPVVNDSVQVGTFQFKHQREELEIAIQPPEITIKRANDRLLQIDDVFITETLDECRRQVLARPVAALLLRQDPVRKNYWGVEAREGLKVYDRGALNSFMELVALYTLGQQDKALLNQRVEEKASKLRA